MQMNIQYFTICMSLNLIKIHDIKIILVMADYSRPHQWKHWHGVFFSLTIQIHPLFCYGSLWRYTAIIGGTINNGTPNDQIA